MNNKKTVRMVESFVMLMVAEMCIRDRSFNLAAVLPRRNT